MSEQNEIHGGAGRRPSGDYAALQNVLDEAYRQSAEGKGNARHANDKPFDKQPILEIGRMVGPGFAAGQIMKKAQEAIGMAARGETEAAANELLGAIVYAASAVVLVREKGAPAEKERSLREMFEEAVSGIAPAAHLIEPEVAAVVAPREFKDGDKVNVRGLADGKIGTIMGARGGRYSVRWPGMGAGSAPHWSADELVHID